MKIDRIGNEVTYECYCGERGTMKLMSNNSGGESHAIMYYPCLGCNEQLLVMANFDDDSVLFASGNLAKEIFDKIKCHGG